MIWISVLRHWSSVILMKSPPLLPASSASSASAGPAREVWSLSLTGAVRGLHLTREKGWVFARDENHWLYLVNGGGERQAQLRAPKPLTGVAASDDSSAFAAGGADGDVWWLAPDLMPRWQRSVPGRVCGLALDPLGPYLVVADASCVLHLFTHQGRVVWQIKCPRALQHLEFVPESAHIVGCADYGLVCCVDGKGAKVWRDGLVAHVGSLSVSGDGQTIALACYTDGVSRYGLKSHKATRLPLPEPCRLAALSYDG